MRHDHEWYTDPRYAAPDEAAPRRCESPGCAAHGEYKAPRHRPEQDDGLRSQSGRGEGDYLWLCLPHVQEYNKKWNYFADMSPAEVERFQREAITGHRPTWRMGTSAAAHAKAQKERDLGADAQEKLERKLFEFLHQRAAKGAEIPPSTMLLKPKLRRAVATLGIDWPLDAVALKKAYKALAKKLHPDLNPGDENAAERFKEVTQAYQLLRRELDGE